MGFAPPSNVIQFFAWLGVIPGCTGTTSFDILVYNRYGYTGATGIVLNTMQYLCWIQLHSWRCLCFKVAQPVSFWIPECSRKAFCGKMLSAHTWIPVPSWFWCVGVGSNKILQTTPPKFSGDVWMCVKAKFRKGRKNAKKLKNSVRVATVVKQRRRQESQPQCSRYYPTTASCRPAPATNSTSFHFCFFWPFLENSTDLREKIRKKYIYEEFFASALLLALHSIPYLALCVLRVTSVYYY